MELNFEDLVFEEKQQEVIEVGSNSKNAKQKKQEGNDKAVEVIHQSELQDDEDEMFLNDDFDEDDYEDDDINQRKKSSNQKSNNGSENKKQNFKQQDDDSFVSIFAKMQLEEGLISSLDEEELNKILEEEGEVAAIKYIAELQRQTAFEQARKIYSEDKNELEEYFILKDAGVDPEVAKELIFNKSMFGNITEEDLEEDEDLRKKVLFQHYKNTTSFSDAKINKEIEKTFAAGDDIEEAIEALKEIKDNITKQIEKEKEEAKKYEKEQKEFIAKERQAFVDLVNKTEEIYPGQKLDKRMKDKIIKMVLEPAVKTQDGMLLNSIWAERAKDPKLFEMRLAYLIASGQFNGDITNVKKLAENDLAKKMEKILNSKSTSVKGGKYSNAGMDNDFDSFNNEQSKPLNFL